MKPFEYVTLEIARERERQIEKEGYNPEHDDRHVDGSIAMAAACYAAPEEIYNGVCDGMPVEAWPWDPEYNKRDKHDRRRQLVIAGALIVAEIERLDRSVGKG